MSEPSKTDTSLDSWEDLLENDQGSTFEKLNEALEKIQIADVRKKTVDPFGKKSARKSSNDGQMKDFQHLAVLYGTLLNAQDAIYKLKRHFGDTVRTKQIDGSNVLFVFSNVMDARNAIQDQKLIAPLCLYSIDDPNFQHADYLFEHRHELKPIIAEVRPATNMSTIRNTVSRHLNISLTPSPQHQQEKEQLKRAREAKKSKADMWK